MRDAAATDTSGLFDTRELSAVLHAMHGRHSSNSTDKVCAIAFPFKKRVFMNGYIKLPIYDPNTSIPAYWEQLISSLASVEVDNPDPYVKEYAPVRVSQSSTVNYFVCSLIPQDITGSQAGPRYNNTLMSL